MKTFKALARPGRRHPQSSTPLMRTVDAKPAVLARWRRPSPRTSSRAASSRDPSDARPAILGFGSAGIDYIAKLDGAFPTPDAKTRASELEIVGGGNCANALVAASRLGARTALVSKVGTDGVGTQILTELGEREGVDVSHVVRRGNRSPFTYIMVTSSSNGDGESTRTCVHTPGETLEVEELGDVAALLEAVHPDVVFFDGRLTESAIALARVAETRGIRVLVECERLRDGLDELVRLADVVVTSKNSPPDRFTETTPIGDAMTEMFACLPKAKVMVTTLGARGAVALVRDGVETPEVGEGTALDDVVSRLENAALRGDDETPGPSVETESLVIRDASGERRFKAKVVFTPAKRLTDNQVVDTTGAGDAFIGTLAMSACSEDFNVASAMRLGAYVAATKCGGIGARSALPHRKDIPESLFEEFPLKSASSRRAAIFSLVLAGLSSLAEPATAADEVDTKKLTELFNRAMQATTYEESEAIWTKAIELSPEGSRARSAAFSNRGTLRLQYQEWQGAVDDLQASVDLDGNNPDPLSLNNLGNAKGALNQWDSAMADFLEASRTEDMRAIALANYALAAFQTERDDLAITTARKLLRRDPEFLDMRAALSAFLWSEGRFDDAEAEWTFLCKSGRGFGAKRSAEEKRDAGAIAYGFELFTQSANQIVAELDGGVKDAGLDTPCRLYKTTDTVANRWPPRATAALDAFLRVRGDGQALDYDGRVKTFNFRH